MNIIDTLKYYGRDVVLPVKEMKRYIEPAIKKSRITEIVDFGAGTLFFSEYFSQLGVNVLAVDTRYILNPPKNNDNKIILFNDILDVLKKIKNKKNKTQRGIFICDVIHHLPPKLWQELLPLITELFTLVMIKDVDAAKKFGFFMSRVHDRVINGETIEAVYPTTLQDALEKGDFLTARYNMPKLWYPHFLILGQKTD